MTSQLATPDVLQNKADKRRIAEAFGKAATTYDAAASLQQLVASRTRLGLPELPQDAQVLDMGCGTGKETRALRERYPAAKMTGLDLSAGMLDFARQHYELDNCQWAIGDIEELPFNEQQFDLVFSSLAIQWCECLSEVLAQVHRVLKPGGWFVFSTLAAGSLSELNAAWKTVDDRPHVNNYESLSCQKQRVASSEFQCVSLRQQTETLYYPAVMYLLREMKALGANTVVEDSPEERSKKGLSGKRALEALNKGYQPYRSDKGLPASYQVIYGVLHKII